MASPGERRPPGFPARMRSSAARTFPPPDSSGRSRMQLIVYGDFNCPYSYLASQRVDELARLGQAEVEWRAV
jgi:hypothetical protein